MCPKVVKEAAPGVLAQIDIAKEVANYDQDEGTFGGVPSWRLSGADRSKKSVEPEIHHSLWSRSEEHTSELQSLMRISYAVFCLKKKTNINKHTIVKNHQQINTS